MNFKNKSLLATGLLSAIFSSIAVADIVQNDDVIINGSSLCVGIDCINGENFGLDTIRLKENNTRLKFIDTSASSSYPTVDWQITANDSTNGGQNKFSIENIDEATVPFTIESGANNNSIYVKDNSFVGFNTNTPLVNLHITHGNSPALRLEQDSSSGFTAQSWDIGGNETNFFVRDVTNGGQLPLRIINGAPSNSIYVNADGDIGLGTSTPNGIFDLAHPSNGNNHAILVDSTGQVGININFNSAPTALFDIHSTDGGSAFSVTDNGNTSISGALNVNADTTITGDITLNSEVYVNSAGRFGVGVDDINDFATVAGITPSLKVQSSAIHGGIQIENTDTNYTSSILFTQNENLKWMLNTQNSYGNNALWILNQYSAPTMIFFQNNTIGLGGAVIEDATKAINHANGAYLSSGGVWTNASSRELKQDIETISAEQAIKALERLEPVTYKYTSNPTDAHAGFIAEDVPDIVATPDRKALASMDIVAVLTRVVKEQQATIKAQQQIVDELTKRIDKVEASQ